MLVDTEGSGQGVREPRFIRYMAWSARHINYGILGDLRGDGDSGADAQSSWCDAVMRQALREVPYKCLSPALACHGQDSGKLVATNTRGRVNIAYMRLQGRGQCLEQVVVTPGYPKVSVPNRRSKARRLVNLVRLSVEASMVSAAHVWS